MDDTLTPYPRAEMPRAAYLPKEKACRGECGRILPATEAHFYRDRGKLRSVCRACFKEDVGERERRVRASGYRSCNYCGTRKVIAEFDPYIRDGVTQTRETCRSCVEKMHNPDPLQEAEVDFRAGLRTGQRWAIGLAILLGRRRMSLADYKALTGDARRAFEARWSELLKEMARDCGEWLTEWDNPAHIPGSRPAPRPEGLRRVA